MTVTTVYATAPGGNGSINSSSTVYATARGVGANLAGSDSHFVGQQKPAAIHYCNEALVIFDTSGLPDTDTVTGVVLSLDGGGNVSTTDFDVIAASSSYDGGSVDAGDWVDGDSLAALTTYATWNTVGYSATYNVFNSAGGAFNSAINMTGNTPIMLYSSRHRDANTPTGDEMVFFTDADAAGTTTDPKLDIFHGTISRVGPTTNASGSSTAPTFARPAGLGNGYVLTVKFSLRSNTTVNSVPSDWNLIASALGEDLVGVYGYYHVVTDALSEPATYVWGLVASSAWSGGIATYAGVDNTTPLDVAASSNAGNATAATVGAITTVTDNAMLGAFIGIDATTSTTITHDGNDGIAEVWDYIGQTRSEFDEGLKATAGDTTSVNWTLSAARDYAAILFALRPAAGVAAEVLPPRPFNVNQSVNRAASW